MMLFTSFVNHLFVSSPIPHPSKEPKNTQTMCGQVLRIKEKSHSLSLTPDMQNEGFLPPCGLILGNSELEPSFFLLSGHYFHLKNLHPSLSPSFRTSPGVKNHSLHISRQQKNNGNYVIISLQDLKTIKNNFPTIKILYTHLETKNAKTAKQL